MANMIKSLAFFLLLSVLLVSVSSLAYNSNHHDPSHGGQGQDPKKEYSECRKKCQRESEPGRREHQPQDDCERQCKEQYEERQEKGGDSNPITEGESQQDNNPYVFEDRHFQTISTQHGRLRVLPKFSDHSKHLRGLVSAFRFAFLEANPQTFVLPQHIDAELILVVVQGRGRISLLRPDGRQSVNLNQGDILRVPAGTTAYLINRDNKEKLVIAKLVQPISTPGEFEPFFGVGAKNPQSFLRAFSAEILEAAFKAKSDRISRLLDQQQGEFVVKASEEQIRALSRKDEEGGKSIWPFGGESKNKINLFDQRPVQSNEFGELREVNPSDFRPLEDLDVSVSFANITQGGMSTIFFNSKSIKISVVTNGEGELQMACPHLAQESQQGRGGSQEGQGQEGSQEGQGGRGRSQEGQGQEGSQEGQGQEGSQEGQGGRGRSQEGQGQEGSQEGQGGSQGQVAQSYERVQARLRQGVVFVTPPGHPLTLVASNNKNLEVLCFEINTRNNERTPLAGKNNIFDQMERVAKELAFNRPSKEVDEILRANNKEWFFKGPNQQEQGRAFE
ncbi:Vicilin-like antimicrobial peptides 2-2 [Heracleum sosnowskyi]|uniref:Vicilin-like antimicrobial peptides 2-2 n=1 Tax=Heracleum sosnowskyi TaxID=360622 RepID=A0AAD8N7W3_9APIA|nr:Vicilin-like antimicrobial peptides 2-2 [Heracleum sosnowskyi]